MEVMKKTDVTEKAMERINREGCYTEEYTINGEEWLYIIHPVKSKRI